MPISDQTHAFYLPGCAPGQSHHRTMFHRGANSNYASTPNSDSDSDSDALTLAMARVNLSPHSNNNSTSTSNPRPTPQTFTTPPSPPALRPLTQSEFYMTSVSSVSRFILATSSPPLTCSICLEALDGELVAVRLLACAHVFHALCIGEWFDSSAPRDGVVGGRCPLCRCVLYVPDLLSGVRGDWEDGEDEDEDEDEDDDEDEEDEEEYYEEDGELFGIGVYDDNDNDNNEDDDESNNEPPIPVHRSREEEFLAWLEPRLSEKFRNGPQALRVNMPGPFTSALSERSVFAPPERSIFDSSQDTQDLDMSSSSSADITQRFLAQQRGELARCWVARHGRSVTEEEEVPCMPSRPGGCWFG
ncbi:hypothetical protein NX059_001200 [Plenodomus lindquistii]|nr:hypothetical protein NX059_001200 [Plenodomus lindquistii]